MPNLSEQELMDRELDMWQEEKNWKASLPKHTDVGWLQIFPEMKKGFFGKTIRLKLRVKKLRLKIEYQMADEDLTHWLKMNPGAEKWIKEMRVERGRETLRLIQKEITAVDYQVKTLSNIGKDP